jgi:Glycosyl hydrolase family 10
LGTPPTGRHQTIPSLEAGSPILISPNARRREGGEWGQAKRGFFHAMLTFVVFDADGIDARHFPPRRAYLHATDELPLQADVILRPGAVMCNHSGVHSKALVVQMSLDAELGATAKAEGLGILTLPTCLLPDREQPYLLAIELARHRIMLFLNKLEDWQLSELSLTHPTMARFEAARQSFTSALIAQRAVDGESRNGYSAKAARLAALSLAEGIEAGEQLALIQAERQIKDRASGQAYQTEAAHYKKLTQESPLPGAPIIVAGSGNGAILPGPAMVGCSISPDNFSEPLQRAAASALDFVTMPMRWQDMEPKEGKYNFASTDRWIEWAVRVAKVPVFAGPLVDFRAPCVPDWLYIWENDYETLRDLVIEHVQSIVTRYRRTIQRWTVASGLNVNTNFKLPIDQVMDLTRVAVGLVKKLHPQAKVQVEIAQPWGEYHATNRRSIPPLIYAEAMIQMGLPIDAIGLRLQMGHAQPGLSTRDLLSLSALLDRYSHFEKPLTISAIGVPSAPIEPKPYQPREGSAAEEPYEPGYWRSAWTESRQAAWLSKALAICASKPFVHSVCWQELADPAPVPTGSPIAAEMPFGGLISSTGQSKPSLAALTLLRQCLKEGKCPFPSLGSV